MGDRFLLYAGHGRSWPSPLKEEAFQDSYLSGPVAKAQAERLADEYDWWVIFDTDSGSFYATWTTGRTTRELIPDS